MTFPIVDRPDTGADPSVPVRHAVIFDLDGVVVDSFAVMSEAFAIAYAEVVGDGPAPFEEYRRHLGRYFPDIMRIMDLPLEMEEPFVRESYRLAGEVEVFDGVTELLVTLRARGLRLAIATGKSGPRARSLLDDLGLLPFFEHVIGSDEVTIGRMPAGRAPPPGSGRANSIRVFGCANTIAPSLARLSLFSMWSGWKWVLIT